MYRLKESDIEYLVLACKSYQYHTGSEYLWEKYENIIEKLTLYKEQNLYAKGMEYSEERTMECPDTPYTKSS
jgi:hypothetical protein